MQYFRFVPLCSDKVEEFNFHLTSIFYKLDHMSLDEKIYCKLKNLGYLLFCNLSIRGKGYFQSCY